MLIAVDCRFAHKQVGLGRFTRELTHALLLREDPWTYVLIVGTEGVSWATSLPSQPRFVIASSRPYSFSEHWEIPSILRLLHADLFFSPHFNVPIFCPIPFVVTIHDLILHRFPNAAPFFKQRAYRMLMGHAVRRAKRIIAVSHFTADEIQRTFGSVVAAKVVVVREGVDPLFHKRSSLEQERTLKKLGIAHPFFLYVGNAKQHKNVQVLIDAFVRANLPATELVLVTAGREVAFLKLHDGVQVLASVSDEELAALYSAARAFVTASLYEGFCLPVAEAAACGCPVIAANCGALPGVVPGHSLLIEPTVSAFEQAFKRSLKREDVPVVNNRWQDTATSVSSVLQDVLS